MIPPDARYTQRPPTVRETRPEPLSTKRPGRLTATDLILY